MQVYKKRLPRAKTKEFAYSLMSINKKAKKFCFAQATRSPKSSKQTIDATHKVTSEKAKSGSNHDFGRMKCFGLKC